MAVDLHDTDHSLLPSQFFDEDYDDLLSLNKLICTNSWSCFGSSDSGSVLSSPVESELGSTEAESYRDEDFIAELSGQMFYYMLQDDNKQEKPQGSASSTQSTSWSPLGSNHESPKGPYREPSPPVPTMIEEFEKIKINKDIPCTYNYSEIPSTVINLKAEFHSKQAIIDNQIRAIQYYKLKQEQAVKQLENKKQHKQYQNKRRACVEFNDGQKTTTCPPSPSSNSTPYSATQQPQTNQQQASSGMRAVFLGGSGSKTKSCGTGVFLPKGIGYSSESRKKQGCSTVIIPARVLQALKQHFDKVGVPSRFNGSFLVQNDALTGRKNSLYSQQQCQSMVPPPSNHQEMNLPQEWTY